LMASMSLRSQFTCSNPCSLANQRQNVDFAAFERPLTISARAGDCQSMR
jgi:hypothetical protein